MTAKAEYEQLKKKYDAVVEYTVHLTAERDAIVAQLEEAQRDLSREISKRRSTAAGEVGKALKTDKLDKKPESKVSSVNMFINCLSSYEIIFSLGIFVAHGVVDHLRCLCCGKIF